MDRLPGVLGSLPYRVMLAMIGPAMKGVNAPPVRRAELVEVLRRNDPRFLRQAIRCFFEYLDRQGSVAPRLCESGVPAWVVFGDPGDVGLRDDERAMLEGCPSVTMVVIADAGHFALNAEPARIAEIVIEAVSHASA